ncbi:Zinc finger, CCHC-type [Lasallia pustulata]|uniref:Zinc finger, CCHC-type n=1 Tax=Lasallia pustulata TaxID=136370 RepID=A0A1W5D8V6_9LECA|nr:Zinc finger, CCHC-type [Lasallia pustulata]
MASADEQDKRVHTRRIILTGFDNWARWSSNTKASMQEKGVWDLTGNGAATQQTAAAMEKAKGTALRIILETVDDNLFCTIDGIEEIAEIWNKLKTTCSQVGQGVVYAILNELFGYVSANKSKGYTKSVNTIFGDVGSLIKRLKSAVREDRDIWDDIHIVVALGALSPQYDNNKAHITTSKELQVQEVQQYMASEEVRINSDRQVGVEPELAMGMQNRGRPMAHNSSYEGRRGLGDDRMCYNCGKPGYIMQNCRQSNRRPDSKRQHDDNGRPFVQNKHPKHRLNKVANVSTDDDNESEEEGKKLPLRMAKQKLPAEDNC